MLKHGSLGSETLTGRTGWHGWCMGSISSKIAALGGRPQGVLELASCANRMRVGRANAFLSNAAMTIEAGSKTDADRSLSAEPQTRRARRSLKRRTVRRAVPGDPRLKNLPEALDEPRPRPVPWRDTKLHSDP